MFCIHCGKQIGDSDVFCEYCGKSQVEEVEVSKPTQEKSFFINSGYVSPSDSSSTTEPVAKTVPYPSIKPEQNKSVHSNLSVASMESSKPEPKPVPKKERPQNSLGSTEGNVLGSTGGNSLGSSGGNVLAGGGMPGPAYISEPPKKPIARTVMFVLLFLAVIGAGLDAYLYYFWQ